MKKLNLSLVTVLAMSTFAIAGGDFAPVEPVVEVPVVVEEAPTPGSFYAGLGYSYFTGDFTGGDLSFYTPYFNGGDLEAHGILGLAGYKINEYFAIEGRYTSTLSDITIGDRDFDKIMTNKAIYLKPVYPVDNFSIYGLLGYGQTIANNSSDEGFQYGAGISFQAMDNVGFFVDYTRLYDDSGLRADNLTLDTVNVGITYAF